jgi:hypothetical protein
MEGFQNLRRDIVNLLMFVISYTKRLDVTSVTSTLPLCYLKYGLVTSVTSFSRKFFRNIYIYTHNKKVIKRLKFEVTEVTRP